MNSINFSIGTHVTAFLGSFAHKFKYVSKQKSSKVQDELALTLDC